MFADLYTKLHYTQIKMLNIVDDSEYTGEGFLDKFVPEKYTPAMADLLNKAGGETITSVQIVRTPLNSALTTMLNGLSGGEYSRQIRRHGYDAYYHLAIVVNTLQGNLYTIEKNEALNFVRGSSRTKQSDVMMVPNFPRITIGQLYSKTRERQGNKYFQYNASSNNCQQFISDALQSVGVVDPTIISFVRQDTESLFKNHPNFRKLANTVTDLAAIGAAAYQAPRMIEKRIERIIKKEKVGKKIRRFFGGGRVKGKTVAELKDIIKRHKPLFKRKILITKLRRFELQELVDELSEIMDAAGIEDDISRAER